MDPHRSKLDRLSPSVYCYICPPSPLLVRSVGVSRALFPFLRLSYKLNCGRKNNKLIFRYYTIYNTQSSPYLSSEQYSGSNVGEVNWSVIRTCSDPHPRLCLCGGEKEHSELYYLDIEQFHHPAIHLRRRVG